MLVKDLIENNPYSLPNRFLNLLPTECLHPDCSSPTEISPTLTGLHCTNPRCPSKVVMRLLALVESLGIMNIGQARAEKFLANFGINNPAYIFAYDFEEDGSFDGKCNADISRQIQKEVSERKNFTLAEYVRVCQLPYIQESAINIFEGYYSLDEAYRDIEAQGVDLIRRKLGIKKGSSLTEKMIKDKAENIYTYLLARKNEPEMAQLYINEDELGIFEGYSLEDVYDSLQSGGVEYVKDRIRVALETRPELDVSVRALKIYRSLMTFKNDLFDALPFVNIISPDSNEIRMLTVVCSTAVGGQFKNKPDFYAYINDKFKDVVHVNFVKSFSGKVDYTIWSGGSQFRPTARVTNKVLDTVSNNEKFNTRINNGESVDVDGRLEDGMHYIPILDADEFIQMLEGLR